MGLNAGGARVARSDFQVFRNRAAYPLPRVVHHARSPPDAGRLRSSRA